MAASDQVGPVQEYQTLRQELLESKRYVFERPLLIATAGIAALSAVKGGYAAAVPLFLVIFLLFNFWFTVNRLHSAARIISYIQLELEEKKFGPWKGWETCLREYRRWLKTTPDAKEFVDSELDKEAVPDALMYYPPIYRLHLGIACLAIISSIVFAILDINWFTITCFAATIILAIWFFQAAYKYQPKLMRTGIERNCVIWKQVLTKMSSTTGGHENE